jgi:hypothetical protein
MKYFSDDTQNNFKADFGFDSPHTTKTKCANPVFANPHAHRIAIMKDEHFGSKGDRDEGGIAGWVVKYVCTGCGKEFKKHRKGFYADKSLFNPIKTKA